MGSEMCIRDRFLLCSSLCLYMSASSRNVALEELCLVRTRTWAARLRTPLLALTELPLVRARARRGRELPSRLRTGRRHGRQGGFFLRGDFWGSLRRFSSTLYFVMRSRFPAGAMRMRRPRARDFRFSRLHAGPYFHARSALSPKPKRPLPCLLYTSPSPRDS